MKITLIFIFVFFNSSFLMMAHEEYYIRKATMDDEAYLKVLYQRVSSISGGLARKKNEITDTYIHELLLSGIYKGLFLVVESDGKIIGSMMKSRVELSAFPHLLKGGSILIDPDFQGKGIGTKLILKFLQEVQDNFKDILRVEISAWETNPAIKLYERLGFKKEGRYESAIKTADGNLIAGISMVWFNPNYAHVII